MSEEISDKKLKAIGLKKAFDGPSEIKIINSANDDFALKVKELYSLDIRAKCVLSRMLKTDNTFSNSLGDIYEYMMDSKVCQKCPGKLSKCPKNVKGYIQNPFYDKYSDEIRLSLLPCEKKAKEEEVLSRISPSYIDTRILKDEASTLLKWMDNPVNDKQLKDTKSYLSSIVRIVKNFDKEKFQQGYLFYSINSYDLSRKILLATGYLFASKGYQVSHIDLPSLFERLKYVSSDPKDDDFLDFKKACKTDCLLLEGVDRLSYLSDEIKTKYLVKMIEERNKVGKITFFAFEKDISLASALKSMLYHQEKYGQLLEILESLALRKTIKDLPL